MPLVSDSPFMSWVYDVFSVYTFSALLGVFEIGAAVLLAVKPWWPKVSVGGSLLAIVLFASTMTGVFTTTGVLEDKHGRFRRARASRRVPDERYCAAGNLRVDPGRRRAGTASLA